MISQSAGDEIMYWCNCNYYDKKEHDTIQLVIFVGLIFRDLGSSEHFMGLYFHGAPPLITSLYT